MLTERDLAATSHHKDQHYCTYAPAAHRILSVHCLLIQPGPRVCDVVLVGVRNRVSISRWSHSVRWEGWGGLSSDRETARTRPGIADPWIPPSEPSGPSTSKIYHPHSRSPNTVVHIRQQQHPCRLVHDNLAASTSANHLGLGVEKICMRLRFQPEHVTRAIEFRSSTNVLD